MIKGVSHIPDPDAPGTRRAKPGQTRLICCRYLRRGTAGQCTAESLFDENSDIQLCARHVGLVLELITSHAGRRPR
jgi:hypothetical protein